MLTKETVWVNCQICKQPVATHKGVACGSNVYWCGPCFARSVTFSTAGITTRCAIICTGPSARAYDLSKITVPKIGVNWSYLGVDSDIHVLSNIVFIRTHGHEFDKLTPTAKFRISPQAIRVAGAFEPNLIFGYAGWMAYTSGKKIPPFKSGFNLYRDGWIFAGGGPCALQAAVSFGFKDIVFVGLDLDTGDTCHFYESNPDESERSGYSRVKLDRAWIIQHSYFEQVKASLVELGIRVTNLGTSDMFERGDFREIC